MDDILAADFTAKAIEAKRSKNDGSYFYLKDALGSVKEITDSQGNIVQQYAYSAFGELISVRDGSGVDIKTDPNIAPYFTYTAREYDAESGLYYYRARYYDASVGRFLQEDQFDGVNMYPLNHINKNIYAENNSIKFTDASGEFVPDVHGRYCGNVRNQASTNNNLNPPAQDSLDEACLKHDLAYSDLGSFYRIDNSSLTFRQARTDFDLIYRGQVHSIKSIGKGDIRGVFVGQSVSYFGQILFVSSSIRTGVSVVWERLKSIFSF